MRRIRDNRSGQMLTAKICIAIILAILLFSVVAQIKEADHDCVGAGCPVCEILMQCEHNIRLLGSALLPSLLGLFSFLIAILIKERKNRQTRVFASLVTESVRMNN
jgi:nucleoside recognition membrane protein YjiH